MIDEARATQAGQWIYDNVNAIADAKSERVKREEYLKVVRSEIELGTQGTMAHKEATALASPEYKKAIDNYSDAVRKETHFQIKMKAAETTIELYRSINANLRGLK